MSNNISALEILERQKKGESLNLLDVRELIEYHTFNIGGKNVPLSVLREKVNQLPWNKTDEIIVMCKIGLRSRTAQSLLEQSGYQHVRNLTGGLISFQKNQKKLNSIIV